VSATVSGFDARVAFYQARLANALEHALPAATLHPARLHEAMRYACEGGKRLRGLLVYAAGEALGVEPGVLDAPACAVELIHAYSLVHDDLPAMDDDALRRGRPTCHIKYDEATAILVGDGLQTLAFQQLACARDISADSRIAMVATLARAAGSRGMVGGQAIDLAAEGKDLSLPELEALHIHKTGALIHACLKLAAACRSDAASERLEALDRYGKAIGLAYQIQDDVLDVESDSATLGKTAGKDEAQLKSTYPAVMGLAAAKERATELFDDAESAVSVFGDQAEPLLWMLERIRDRKH